MRLLLGHERTPGEHRRQANLWLACHHDSTSPDTRILRVFADTDAPAVREWAWNVYEAYDTEAIEMEGFGPEGLRRVMETSAFSS